MTSLQVVVKLCRWYELSTVSTQFGLDILRTSMLKQVILEVLHLVHSLGTNWALKPKKKVIENTDSML